ncbi:MAG: hypothetical protein KJ666_11405 [Bacteroidetes bacterium]|nr:hypothetical protein [Bacteroidota bacterium]
MDKERLIKLADVPKFISDIYNYCDRWCERCQFTSRCLNFVIGEELYGSPKDHDLNNAIFWKKINKMFQITRELLNEMVEREGIDLNAIDYDEFNQREKIREETVYGELSRTIENHDCAVDAKAYIELVNDWFESSIALFEKRAEELELKARLELPNDNPIKEANLIKDAVEIIRWYQHQIYVKMVRAIHGQTDGEEESLEDFPKDSDGSAKVALIGIDRSISAWSILYSEFPEHENEILNVLLRLDQLRKKIEKAFPSARAFVRPGFDEIDN